MKRNNNYYFKNDSIICLINLYWLQPTIIAMIIINLLTYIKVIIIDAHKIDVFEFKCYHTY